MADAHARPFFLPSQAVAGGYVLLDPDSEITLYPARVEWSSPERERPGLSQRFEPAVNER